MRQKQECKNLLYSNGFISATMSKQIIAVDIDDVLSLHAEAFIAYSNKTYNTQFKVEDYNEHWADLWGVNFEELENRVSAYHESGIFEKYQPRADAAKVLKKLSKDYVLIVITSRKSEVTEITTSWLTKHYPDIFESIHHAGMWDVVNEASLSATKAKLSKELGASYIIDDQLKHCVDSARLGINAILFGNYRWNQAVSLPDNVTRCSNWNEVNGYFYANKTR
jgi:uncharacterized HAD superfamily protein